MQTSNGGETVSHDTQVKHGVRELPLTRGKVALVDEGDWERVSRFKWQALRADGGLWYAYHNFWKDGKAKHVALHRFILRIDQSNRPLVDHRNRNGLDCRRENLRLATQSQNLTNTRLSARNKSGYKGVSICKRTRKAPWLAQIRKDKKLYYLGHYKTPQEAALAYDNAARKLHGEFATLNFPAAHERSAHKASATKKEEIND